MSLWRKKYNESIFLTFILSISEVYWKCSTFIALRILAAGFAPRPSRATRIWTLKAQEVPQKKREPCFSARINISCTTECSNSVRMGRCGWGKTRYFEKMTLPGQKDNWEKRNSPMSRRPPKPNIAQTRNYMKYYIVNAPGIYISEKTLVTKK